MAEEFVVWFVRFVHYSVRTPVKLDYFYVAHEFTKKLVFSIEYSRLLH